MLILNDIVKRFKQINTIISISIVGVILILNLEVNKQPFFEKYEFINTIRDRFRKLHQFSSSRFFIIFIKLATPFWR